MKQIAALIATLMALPALAHGGHGMLGSHWHATDVLGFAATAGAILALLWLTGRGK